MPEPHDTALLKSLMEAAADAIVMADGQGIIQRANTAADQLFGYDEGALIGQSVNVLMPDAVAALHDGFMNHHMATGQVRIIGIGRDVEGQRRDGTIFPLHLSVGKAEVEGAHIFIGILHDLTQRRAAQEALARTQRLDAVGQLTGGIAHDFNNLLTVIIGNLELMQMRGVDERQAGLIDDALASAELGADLTARLLVFARKGDLKPVRVDLREQCGNALAILRRTIGDTYSIRTEFADTVSSVMIDPVQLQSALINLALNARDAMPRGGEFLISVADIRIDDKYMAQETDMPPGDYVRLFVSDNGEGMSLDAQRRAFEPFFTTKSDKGGTGLGLAMVYGFVKQSGGHITLYSEEGHGTSFGLYFPALRDDWDDQANKDVVYRTREGDLPRGAGQVVLVVEDNPNVRRLSIERVRDLGYRTEEAENGDVAYALLSSGVHVDLVFSDLVMPGKLNGYDLAAKIRQEFPDIRILLTSGYASDVVSNRMGATEDDLILHKPYRLTDLAARLHALL
ncbi:histidine kinase [Tateyamaria omphalii]|uniref:PAS domain S-box protein n=1 Tax=Tateyamaria omphalii TaxID=299262 RepID=UPI0019956165|nr:PAS domain S-box protein [Tateyamaria omphalii]GGX66026.1 histidine kinase [Tateyamaria omphalii]